MAALVPDHGLEGTVARRVVLELDAFVLALRDLLFWRPGDPREHFTTGVDGSFVLLPHPARPNVLARVRIDNRALQRRVVFGNAISDHGSFSTSAY